ncbi:MAG: LON peptidase substrate-binding domain-containing protein [Myxococcales bacterium]|nr:LON peptidase substrate-binding domain-containing protein [Myxococcales bacterium]
MPSTPRKPWVAPLSAAANLEHLKKQAKELRVAIEQAEPEAMALVARHLHPDKHEGASSLTQAQHILARQYGFDSWPKLKAHLEARAAARARIEQIAASVWSRPERVLKERGGLVDPVAKRTALEACQTSDVPLLTVRDFVLFPGTAAPLSVLRPRSLALVDALQASGEALVGVFCQHDPAIHEPGQQDLQAVGVLAQVEEIVPVPGEATTLFVVGLARVSLQQFTQTEPYARARVAALNEQATDGQLHGLTADLRDCARQIVSLMPGAPANAQTILDRITDPRELADAIAVNLDAPQDVKGALLGTSNDGERLGKLLGLVQAQLTLLQAQRRTVG